LVPEAFHTINNTKCRRLELVPIERVGLVAGGWYVI